MKLKKHINVANKIATYDKLKEGIIVCGNSNYEIEFTFDEEWDEYPTKKARFTTLCNDEYSHINVEFTGSICPVPPLFNASLVEVGVFIDGGISTTTAAEIKCRKSALCKASKSMLSPEQIIGLNEALKGEQGPAGHTPVKGVDYYTEEDKAELMLSLKDELDALLGDVNSAFDDLHQVALSYQIGDIESAMQNLTDAVDGLESEVSGSI